MRLERILAAFLVLLAAACEKAGDGGDPAPVPQFESRKSELRFKRNERLRNDFSAALGLAPGELCNELGQYSCTDLVHPIALGDVEPFVIGLYEPLPETGVTAPIVVDRVALAGCRTRAARDFAKPGAALIFTGLHPLTAGGGIAPSKRPRIAQSVDALYVRAVQRHATPAEIAHLDGLYDDVALQVGAEGGADPAEQWATLACFAVLTSMESLFY